MAELAGKRFDNPDEVREFTDGRAGSSSWISMATRWASGRSSLGGVGRRT